MEVANVGKIWQIAKKPLGGRPRRFNAPEELWEEFIKYCEWVDANPWQKKSANNSLSDDGGGGKRNAVRQDVKVLQRPYTLYGFCAFACIPKWADFKASYISLEGFSEVITQIENIITSYQVDGAMLHQFDSNLVARLNGIADKQVTEISGDVSGFKFPKFTEDDLEELKRINDKM